MDKKTLKKIFLMSIFLMASIGFVSCSSSDDNDEPEPVPVIPELDQKLLNGIWISGDMEKGNLYTMQFTEDKVRTIVIANRKEYRQVEYDYEVEGNNIVYIGSKSSVTIIVKSFAENEMEVELSNYPEVGMTTTNTYVRRYPTTAQGIENTNWKVKMNVPWVNAITDELTLPGNLTIDGKNTISLVNYSEVFRKIIGDDFRMMFNDDQTLAQLITYDGSSNLNSYPYELDGHNMSFLISNGLFGAMVNHTFFKTEEGSLCYILEKDAVIAYTLNYLVNEAVAQGCKISSDEWLAFASKLNSNLELSTLLLILEPDTSGRNYVKEALIGGKWVRIDDEGELDVMVFMEDGTMLNSFTYNEGSGEAKYQYKVEGNKLTLINSNNGEFQYTVFLSGNELVMKSTDYSEVYYRQADE